MSIPDSMKIVRGRGRPRLMKIPESFQVLGHTVTVRIVPQSVLNEHGRKMGLPDAENGEWGLYDHVNKTIYLDDTMTGDMLEQTFLHEKVHCILDHMGQEELSSDESFVDLFAEIDYQISKTFKVKKKSKSTQV